MIVSHVYVFSGTYRIILTVADDHGGSTTTEYVLTLPSYPPEAPAITRITATSGGVELTWTVPASDGGRPITNYRIFRGTAPSNLSPHATVGNTISYLDPGPLDGGQTYYYAVVALNDAGESGLSEVKDVLVPASAGSGILSIPISSGLLAGTGVAVSTIVAIAGAYVLSRRKKDE